MFIEVTDQYKDKILINKSLIVSIKQHTQYTLLDGTVHPVCTIVLLDGQKKVVLDTYDTLKKLLVPQVKLKPLNETL